MKQLAVLALAVSAAIPIGAAPNVAVSIGIQQPGVYGRIDIGNYREPDLVYAEPMLIAPSRVATHQQPIYMYVPTSYQRDWRRHCRRYYACGQPVYFVREQWVRERYQQEHRGPPHGGRGRGPDPRRHGNNGAH